MSYSSKLSAHYLELAKTSISEEGFSGEDVRFSSEYEGLESELSKAQSMHESGQIDWVRVCENSETLLRTQSKDLRVGGRRARDPAELLRRQSGRASGAVQTGAVHPRPGCQPFGAQVWRHDH